MKNRANSSELVTKRYLDMRLEELKKGVIEKLDTKAQTYRDQILTKMDETMKELERGRENRVIEPYQVTELREDVRELKKRVAKLEYPHSTG